MYPYNGSGGQVPMMRGMSSRIIQHDTDIDRLWRLMEQQSEGVTFGNDPANAIPGYPGYGSGGGGASGKIYEGRITSTLSKPTNGLTAPTTCTVSEYDEDPGSPGDFILTGASFTITNRDENLAIGTGVYVHYVKVVTGLGNTEYRITWVSR